jgi:hypothetical protein
MSLKITYFPVSQFFFPYLFIILRRFSETYPPPLETIETRESKTASGKRRGQGGASERTTKPQTKRGSRKAPPAGLHTMKAATQVVTE